MHHPHQLPQKSSTTYFPRSDESLKSVPSGRLRVKSGAGSPGTIRVFASRTWRGFGKQRPDQRAEDRVAGRIAQPSVIGEYAVDGDLPQAISCERIVRVGGDIIHFAGPAAVRHLLELLVERLLFRAGFSGHGVLKPFALDPECP